LCVAANRHAPSREFDLLKHSLETKKAVLTLPFFGLMQTYLLSADFFDFLDFDFLAGLADFLVDAFGASALGASAATAAKETAANTAAIKVVRILLIFHPLQSG
jgi:hypothetical protein